jgi:hypothetical protein
MSIKLYIAGPMTGLDDHNFPAFHAAAHSLRNAGYETIHTANPENLEPEKVKSTTWEQWLRKAIAVMMEADAIALLPGWQASRGARLEVMVGLEVGMRSAPIREWIFAAENRPDTLPAQIIAFDEANKQP